MARLRTSYVCQNCGAITPALAGQVRLLRRVEHHHRGGGGARRRRRRRRGAARPDAPSRSRTSRATPRRSRASSPASANSTGSPAAASSPGSATLDRRRAGHRQVDAADPGLRGAGAARRPGRLRLGRRIDRTGAPARRRASASPRRRCSSRLRLWSRTSSQRSARATRRSSSSSIPSRPCGATRSNPRPAR